MRISPTSNDRRITVLLVHGFFVPGCKDRYSRLEAGWNAYAFCSAFLFLPE
jgi:hypothetical protein